MKNGLIFDIKRYAIHDGQGIRTTVFLKGCPMQCWWCHNPEGQSSKSELTFIENRCIKDCHECLNSCQKEALSFVNNQISINREECNLCGDCTDVCPTEALEIIGRKISIEEVIEEIEKDVVFYDESSGGVTFSGGEPLIQPDFLDALLEECKKRGIHTTLDTSGYASFKVLEKIRKKVDIFMYDVKMMHEGKHKKFTGVSNKLILENLRKLSEKVSNIIIRIPIIPGINDNEENITQTAKFISTLQGIQYISLLPYHKVGKQKYKRLNRTYLQDKTPSPTYEKIEKIKKELEHTGFVVKTGD